MLACEAMVSLHIITYHRRTHPYPRPDRLCRRLSPSSSSSLLTHQYQHSFTFGQGRINLPWQSVHRFVGASEKI